MVVCHLRNKLRITYGASGALSLARRMGFFRQKARPVPYNSATEKEKEYVERTIKEIRRYDDKHYKIVLLDAASFVDAPSSTQGIRLVLATAIRSL